MKLLIYPVSKHVSPLVRYGNLLNFDQVALCAPKGWCRDSDDFSVFDGGIQTGKQVHTDINHELFNADAVYFPKSPVQLRLEYLRELVNNVIHLGKQVFLDDESIPGISGKRLNVTILQGEDFIPDLIRSDTPEVCKIPVPVIFAMGIGPETNKMIVQLALRQFFLEKGYRISQVGTARLSSFFGFHAFPNIFFSNELSIREKIIGLNRYLYHKYLLEKPEVMIIGLPGGIMPLNSVRYEELGEMAYLISQAVTPDCSVLCSYAVSLTADYINKIKQICQFRLGAPVNNLVISNTEIELSLEDRTMRFHTIGPEQVLSKCNVTNIGGMRVFRATHTPDLIQMARCVYEELIHN